MKLSTALFSAILLSSLMLSGCAYWDSPSNKKRAICNKLKSDIVFSGATSDTRRANIQEAEQPLEQRSYDQNDCGN